MSHLRGAAILILVLGGCASSPTASDQPMITYQAKDADLATVLEEVVRQGRLNILWGVVIGNDTLSCESGSTHGAAPFSVAVDAGVTQKVGTASVRFDALPAREAVDALAQAFGLSVTDPHPRFVRLSKP